MIAIDLALEARLLVNDAADAALIARVTRAPSWPSLTALIATVEARLTSGGYRVPLSTRSRLLAALGSVHGPRFIGSLFCLTSGVEAARASVVDPALATRLASVTRLARAVEAEMKDVAVAA